MPVPLRRSSHEWRRYQYFDGSHIRQAGGRSQCCVLQRGVVMCGLRLEPWRAQAEPGA
ncbi:hypothetical protein PM082_016605 [Marasmius tenuissimus]|nr:hypothetical protein PM082_016605 [Marasmius tenuissimus]